MAEISRSKLITTEGGVLTRDDRMNKQPHQSVSVCVCVLVSLTHRYWSGDWTEQKRTTHTNTSMSHTKTTYNISHYTFCICRSSVIRGNLGSRQQQKAFPLFNRFLQKPTINFPTKEQKRHTLFMTT